MPFKIALFSLMFSFAVISAQKDNFSSFNVVSLNYQFHPKFFLFTELQERGNEDFSYPDYYEIKGGVGYNLTKNHKPLIGIGRYANYKNKDLDKEEFRVWLQDVINVKTGRFKFENRFRLEQSWFYEPNIDVRSTRNRLRYRLNISAPLNSKKVEPGTVFANVFSEVFFVTPKPTFGRNRLYTGLAYQITEQLNIASGYLWQREFQTKGNRNFHYVYFAFNINIDPYKNVDERRPSVVPD